MITKLNTSSPSFGVVKKSAIELAIKIHGSDLSSIKRIKDAVNSQKDNDRYDVVGEEYRFYVFERGTMISDKPFFSFTDACSCAEDLKKFDIMKEQKFEDLYRYRARIEEERKQAKRLADELLASTED